MRLRDASATSGGPAVAGTTRERPGRCPESQAPPWPSRNRPGQSLGCRPPHRRGHTYEKTKPTVRLADWGSKMGTSNAPLAGFATVVPAALAAPGQEGRLMSPCRACFAELSGSCPRREKRRHRSPPRSKQPRRAHSDHPRGRGRVRAGDRGPGPRQAQSNEELLGIIRDQQRRIEELSRRLERVEELVSAAAPDGRPRLRRPRAILSFPGAPSPTLRSADGLFEGRT